jgi:hypothetical protein
MPNAKYQIPNSKYQIPNSKFQITNPNLKSQINFKSQNSISNNSQISNFGALDLVLIWFLKLGSWVLVFSIGRIPYQFLEAVTYFYIIEFV